MFQVTAFYAALLTFIYLFLTFRVIKFRRANQVSMGDQGNNSLLKRMRAHANFAEYAPIGLILLGLTEASGAPVVALHFLGGMLFLGRGFHAYGFSASPPIMRLRVWGMMLTLTMLLISAIGLLLHTLF